MSDDNEFTMSRFLTQEQLYEAMRTRIREQAERIERMKAALAKLSKGNRAPGVLQIAREALAEIESKETNG